MIETFRCSTDRAFYPGSQGWFQISSISFDFNSIHFWKSGKLLLNDYLNDCSVALNAEGVFQPQRRNRMWYKANKYMFLLTDLPKSAFSRKDKAKRCQ